MLAPLFSVLTLVGLGVVLAFAAGLAGIALLVFRGLVGAAGHHDPARRRRGRRGYYVGLALFEVGFLGTLALFVLDDATTAATGLGFGDLLSVGIGATAVGGVAMVVGLVLALEEGL